MYEAFYDACFWIMLISIGGVMIATVLASLVERVKRWKNYIRRLETENRRLRKELGK